ncbi:MAG: hypothetical protein IPG58_00270 [Acidobacteria bacterium]|nr:hypothetical protein [Acidobacteriota bacterium]
MKKTVSVALMFTLVLTAFLPTFAQGQRSTFDQGAKIRTQFAGVVALTDGKGVLVQWEMAVERRNVGFYVYREGATDGGLVSPVMVLGASARSSEEVTSGGRYQLFDPQGSAHTEYVIRSVGRDGNEISSRTARVSMVKDLEAITGAPASTWAMNGDVANKTRSGGKLELHSELRQLVEDNLQTPDLMTHRWVVGQPGAKISVRKEGMYRVTAGELAAAGFDTESNPAGWRLFAEGVEQAILVPPGNAYIEFYGKPIDTTESDTRIYYLINDVVPGKRMETKVLRPIGGTSVSANYPVNVVKKERTSFDSTIHNGDVENYWGRVITSFATTYPFALSALDATGDVTFTVRLQGYSNGTHLVRLILNGTQIQSMTWSGYNSFSQTLTLPANRFVEGVNNLEMTGLNPGDFSLFDSLSVQHKRRYEAEQNRLGFFTPGYRKVDVRGFTSQNVRVFDTTVDGNPKQIANVQAVQDGSTFKVTLPSSRNFVAYAIDDSALLVSPAITKNNPSNYASSNQGYDLVIISHGSPDFMAASESWADYRRGQGFSAKVIDVADLFDEFNYGSASADSIKSFLNHAFNSWTNPPQYLLLMGDSAHDPKNYEGFGNWSLVPSKNVQLEFEETASDEALADFNGDGLAEFAVGRIPARNLAMIQTAFAKTQSFETQPNQSLSRGALFAFDLPNGWDFGATSVQLAEQLPPGTPVVFVDRQDPGAQLLLINELSGGKYIANYAGHGALGLWASSSFFSSSTVPQLTNADRPTFFTMLTCLNGYFIVPNPNFDSLSEHLLKSSGGGAVATWASTARTTPDIQAIMALRFYGKLAEGQINRAGDLVEDAKNVIPAGDVRFSWVLLGDPMLKMR